MDTLINSYRDEGSDDLSHSNHSLTDLPPPPESTTTIMQQQSSSPHETTNGTTTINNDNNNLDPMDSTSASTAAELNDLTGEEDDEDFEPPPKKQKHLSLLTPSPSKTPNSSASLQNGVKTMTTTTSSVTMTTTKKVTKMVTTGSKKAKKKSNNANSMWTKPTSRKGKKKGKAHVMAMSAADAEDKVLITPIPRFPDKTDDTPDMKICLSKVYKAEKVELSDDRLSAGSTKGYRMVRATRGVTQGAWYFEIKVVKLGETGHTRLGFSTEKGDLQAPVGYDANSFGYRDIDGSKVHKAMREQYGEEGYKEGDVIGFYINMPDGDLYAPKPPHLVWFKGQKYMCGPDAKEDPPKVVPGSEISFFKNGVCQGVAFDNLFGGRYYPAASMYTLPNQPNCIVKFNFGPDFEFPPENLDDRPAPKPMIEAPYHGYERQVQNGISDEKKPK